MRNSIIFITVFIVFGLLTFAVSMKSGKGFRTVFKESGDKIFTWAMPIALFLLVIVFAIFMIVNN